MKSVRKIIQGTKIWLPPYNNEKFFRRGRGRGEEEERKRRGKRSEEGMKRSRSGGPGAEK